MEPENAFDALTDSGTAIALPGTYAIRWKRILCVLFFFSGFPALIYQLVWQRALFRIFGVNIESVTIVVTAFMIGLGLGSLAGGWLSRRRSIPLLPLLAAIELLTGSFGIVSLDIFDKVGSIALGMPLTLTAIVTLLLVIVPTLLMGATLPVLVSHLVSRSGNVGSSVGLLYYVNTLGAGASCLVCACLLFPFFGMQTVIYMAASMNALVASGALVVHVRDRREVRVLSTQPPARPASSPVLGFGTVLALAFAGGFISLSYEIFFFRTVSFATGSSALAFAVTLGAFLVGLASGSREAGEWCEAAGENGRRGLVEGLILANLLGSLFLPIVGHLGVLGPVLLGVCLLLVYFLARKWGILFPCLAHLGVAADNRAGMQTALLYLANIAGSATGCILTGFVLMDRMRLVNIAIVLVLAGLVCTMLLAISLPLSPQSKWLNAGKATGLGAVTLLLLPSLTSGALESLMWKKSPDATTAFANVIENRSGIITVDQTGAVYGNGMYDGRFKIDLFNDINGIVRPYALSLFHPHPRNVLMIGFASGSWAQVIANNPEVSSLTIIEINPGYLELVAQKPEVASVLTNPKVRIVTDDGRRWLHRNPGSRFDAIVSNTTWHFRANATNLLSTEFLDLIKEHLQPGGIFYYNTTGSERAQRTGCLAYPYGALFTNHMVVSLTPLAVDYERWFRILEAYRINGQTILDLRRNQDRQLAAQLKTIQIENCPDILARTIGKIPITDDNMGTEWRYPLGMQ
ncbi:MAG: methyltransferase domain-containing protein [Formivibrio sp.]|nr:methyltransferase domain-containing protein [Formivibrio sp.]